MEFGFGAPSRGPLASPENLVALAQKGEELGFEILSVSDHIVVPNSIASVYPYNESGAFVSSVAGSTWSSLRRSAIWRDYLNDKAADVGYGAAAPESGADGEDSVHD